MDDVDRLLEMLVNIANIISRIQETFKCVWYTISIEKPMTFVQTLNFEKDTSAIGNN